MRECAPGWDYFSPNCSSVAPSFYCRSVLNSLITDSLCNNHSINFLLLRRFELLRQRVVYLAGDVDYALQLS